MSDLIRLMVGPEQSDNAHFGALMQLLRGETGLSRAAAADKAGLSSEFVRLIEKGDRTPAAGTVRGMLEGYGVPFESRIDHDNYVFIFRGHEVQFTSRIQEARRKSNHAPTISRNEQIGQIVSLLTISSDETLKHILSELVIASYR